MTLHIDLNQETETRLRAAAGRQGLALEQYATRILEESFQPVLSPPRHAALALLQQWDREDQTDDPAELARRTATLRNSRPR